MKLVGIGEIWFVRGGFGVGGLLWLRGVEELEGGFACCIFGDGG